MKVIITGHTKGIGREFFKYFSKNNYDVIGVSKSTGYDITDESIRQEILKLSQDADIFVNNAFVNNDYSQFIMLTQIYEQWAGKDKIIINLSSFRASYFVEDFEFPKYYEIKKKINDYCIEKQWHSRRPYLINLRPGKVDTERNIDENQKKMNVEDVITVIDFILANKNKFHVLDIGWR